MPRYYVEKDNKWNIFSSIVDDFLYDDFVDFNVLKGLVIKEAVDNLVEEKEKDLDSLLTDQPIVNTMFYEDAIERIKITKDVDKENNNEIKI